MLKATRIVACVLRQIRPGLAIHSKWRPARRRGDTQSMDVFIRSVISINIFIHLCFCLKEALIRRKADVYCCNRRMFDMKMIII